MFQLSLSLCSSDRECDEKECALGMILGLAILVSPMLAGIAGAAPLWGGSRSMGAVCLLWGGGHGDL